MARIFLVVAVLWTGWVIFLVKDEDFKRVRLDDRTSKRLAPFFSDLDISLKYGLIPHDRSEEIKSALKFGRVINAREDATINALRLNAASNLMATGISQQIREQIARAVKFVEAGNQLWRDQHSEYLKKWKEEGPVDRWWDFRGVEASDYEDAVSQLSGTLYRLEQITREERLEIFYFRGQLRITGMPLDSGAPASPLPVKYTGLTTGSDYELLEQMKGLARNRLWVKPLFWLSVWVFPMLAAICAGIVFTELMRWIGRGFQSKD